MRQLTESRKIIKQRCLEGAFVAIFTGVVAGGGGEVIGASVYQIAMGLEK